MKGYDLRKRGHSLSLKLYIVFSTTNLSSSLILIFPLSFLLSSLHPLNLIIMMVGLGPLCILRKDQSTGSKAAKNVIKRFKVRILLRSAVVSRAVQPACCVNSLQVALFPC